MAGALLQPEAVGPEDRARILGFVNGADDASVLADTIGFSEGPLVGRQIADAILERRATGGPFLALDELLAVTGVNLARFTEIAVALSGARPPAAASWTMRLTPSSTRPWVGQSVQIVGQLIDAQGLGVPGAEVLCVTSSGVLSAPNSLGELQRGAAVRLTTEPGGIVRLELEPRLAPPLGRDARNALESELRRVGSETDPPATVAPALAAFAERYRAEANSALRDAVDRLFEAYPVDAAGVGSTWPVETVTIIAISDIEGAQPALAGTATLFVRNWLGGWLSALGAAIQSDRRLDEALSKIEVDAIDADTAYRLIAATQAFAGLEYGVLGARERDKLSGQHTSRFLDRLGKNMDPVAIENVVLAAGAAHGGVLDSRLFQLEATVVDKSALDTLRGDIFTRTDTKLADFGGKVAALEADRVTKAALDAGLAATVKDLRAGMDTAIGRTRAELSVQINAKADQASVNQSFKTLIDGRLAQLETRAVDRAALDGLRNDLISLTDGKVAAVRTKVAEIESDRVTKNQLSALEAGLGRVRAELSVQINAKADQAAVNQSFKTLIDGRLAQLETRAVDRAALDGLRNDLISLTDGKIAAVSGKVAVLESDRVTRAQLAGLEARFTQLNSAVGTTRTELLAQINTKADQSTVAGLNQSVGTLQKDNQRIAKQFEGVDPEVFRTSRNQPRGPSR